MISIIFCISLLSAFHCARTEKLTIASGPAVHHFTVEIALTTAEQAKGLMNRTEMEKDHGMIFVYNSPKTV